MSQKDTLCYEMLQQVTISNRWVSPFEDAGTRTSRFIPIQPTTYKLGLLLDHHIQSYNAVSSMCASKSRGYWETVFCHLKHPCPRTLGGIVSLIFKAISKTSNSLPGLPSPIQGQSHTLTALLYHKLRESILMTIPRRKIRNLMKSSSLNL